MSGVRNEIRTVQASYGEWEAEYQQKEVRTFEVVPFNSDKVSDRRELEHSDYYYIYWVCSVKDDDQDEEITREYSHDVAIGREYQGFCVTEKSSLGSKRIEGV